MSPLFELDAAIHTTRHTEKEYVRMRRKGAKLKSEVTDTANGNSKFEKVV
jgi:hypothetical protein